MLPVGGAPAGHTLHEEAPSVNKYSELGAPVPAQCLQQAQPEMYSSSLENYLTTGVAVQAPVSQGLGFSNPAAAPVATAPPTPPTEAKQQICFDFTKNQCSRGASCKFSHNVDLIIQVNSQEKGICFDYLKGMCSRGALCRFSHDLRNLQTLPSQAPIPRRPNAPICYDFVKSQCARGDECKYSHDYSSILTGPRPGAKNPFIVCVDFTRGRCTRGAACRYAHGLSMGGGPMAPLSYSRQDGTLSPRASPAAAAAAAAATTIDPSVLTAAIASGNYHSMGSGGVGDGGGYGMHHLPPLAETIPASWGSEAGGGGVRMPAASRNDTNTVGSVYPGYDARDYAALLQELQSTRLGNSSTGSGGSPVEHLLRRHLQPQQPEQGMLNMLLLRQQQLLQRQQQQESFALVDGTLSRSSMGNPSHIHDGSDKAAPVPLVPFRHSFLSKTRSENTGAHQGIDSPTIGASWGETATACATQAPNASGPPGGRAPLSTVGSPTAALSQSYGSTFGGGDGAGEYEALKSIWSET